MESIGNILKKYKDSKKDIHLLGADLISQKGYTIVPNFILNHKKLTPYAKIVYIMLLSYAWNKGAVFPGQVRLAEECGISERSVRYALTELKKGAFLTIVQRGLGKTNLYILHFRKQRKNKK